MKKAIITSCTIASLILILDSIGAGHMIMMFVFVGIIPGTDTALSSSQMLILFEVLTGLVVLKIWVLPITRKLITTSKKPNQLVPRRLKRA